MRKSLHARKHIGFASKTTMVFQNYNLFKNKTALQNITEALIVAQHKPRDEAKRIGMEILKQVGLEHKADSYPITMSGLPAAANRHRAGACGQSACDFAG